jgi:outer membrane protein
MVVVTAVAGLAPALADTMEAALVRAYRNNPKVNAQRAHVRSTDENVPQALSAYRPKVALTASAGYQYADTLSIKGISSTAIARNDVHGTDPPRSAGVTGTQTLFNGNQTANKTRVAESQVSGAREALRLMEETVLLSAATIYMDFLRDAAIVEVQRNNTMVLEQTLQQTRQRFDVGTVTRTDVAQAEAQLAAGKSQQLTAEANLVTTRANFRRIIGDEPANLAPGSPVDRFLPKSLPAAVELSLLENPTVTAAMFGIDVNYLQVKINEGALLPTLSLVTSVQEAYEQTLTAPKAFTASAVAQVTAPVYQGGTEYSLIRQSKENLAQQRLNLEMVRDQTRANTVTAWGQLEAGKATVTSAQSQVTRVGNCAHRRSPGGHRRTANHARRAQRAADAGQRPGRARHRATRPRGRFLCNAERGRPVVAAGTQPADRDLRSRRALPTGSRQLVWRADA